LLIACVKPKHKPNSIEMKKPLFSALHILIMLFSSYPIFAQPDLSGYWEGVYSNNKGHVNDSLSCSVYQLNDSIHGSLFGDGSSATFHGHISDDFDSLYVTVVSSSGRVTKAQCLLFSDSLIFTYASADNSTIGFGYVVNTAPSRTVIVHYNYTGTKEVSTAVPLSVGLFDNPDILSSNPILSLEFAETSGTAYFTGVPRDTVYCMIYAGYSDSLKTFIPIELSYFIYGNSATMECDTIVVTRGEVEEITLNFDDTYPYPMEADFPGGKLDIVNTVSLPFSPRSIASDQKGNIYISNSDNHYSFRYNKNIELQDTLRNSEGDLIFAYTVKFAPDSSFYAIYSSNVNHYSKTHQFLESFDVGSYLVDLAIDGGGNVFAATNSEIIRLNADLSLQTASIDLEAIKGDYTQLDNTCEIRSVAINNDNKVAIGIESEAEDIRIDVVVFYNNDLSEYDHAIWENWLFNNPIDIEFDKQGKMYVVNYWEDDLIVFDALGKRFQANYWIDREGTLNGAMNGPTDLALSGGWIYVVEDLNNRVSIFRLAGSIEENLSVTDTTIHSTESACFDALDTITLAGNPTTVVFESGSSVNLIAGRSIRILPGFYAQSGSYLHGYITTSNSFCDQVEQSIVYKQPGLKSEEANLPKVVNPESTTDKQMKVYPNPTDGQFTVELTNFEGPAMVTLINPLGSVVATKVVDSAEQAKVQLSALHKGLYVVRVRSGNDSRTSKILIR
jgi:hypothetical protein